jgi:hypothetical protein
MNQQATSRTTKSLTSNVGVSSLNLASLCVNDNPSQADQALSRRWGSAETRKAYDSLQSLADASDKYTRQDSMGSTSSAMQSSAIHVPQQWGYFVDSEIDDEMECDNFF